VTPNRRQQRRFALQIIYSLHFDQDHSKHTLAASFDNFWAEENTSQDRESSYAWTLTQGVFQHEQALDEIIARHSRHWKLNRIAKVELTILRLALYEMLHCPDMPVKVVINEAVELAKDFGDDNSKIFVNGVLDAAAREREQA
jgi:N utilization substance protein B